MFYFFFDEDISNNVIIQEAFQEICFEKLIYEGYCDMNPILGKPTINKEEIAFELDKRKSPLSILFKQQYPKTLDEAKNKLFHILDNLVLQNKAYDNYSRFAIVYYIFRAIPTYSERQKTTQEMFDAWKNQNDQYIDMDIRISSGIVFDYYTINMRIINSISNYMDILDEINSPDQKVFFRGHCDVSYRLIPSIFRRKEWIDNEKKMHQELQISCPNEFANLKNHLEVLAEMQHYGLPTRLLDITQNPLVALYFACENSDIYSGEVIFFSFDKDCIKYPQSDTVSVLASLPLFTRNAQEDFYEASLNKSLTLAQFNERIARLVQEVRLERPGFKDEVLPEDLRKNVVVIPSRNNKRIEKQDGAFIICGLLEEIYGKKQQNAIAELRSKNQTGQKIVCIIQSKDKLKKQLNSLGVNKSRIYPEIDDVADYIKNHTSEL